MANYVELTSLTKGEDGKINGAILHDSLTKKEFPVKAKVVVNCTGIFADQVRKMDKPEAEDRILGARGTHLMFKKGMFPENTGIIIPDTTDGRLLFVINYLGHPMVGTTDKSCEITHNPEPDQEEIDFIIKEIKPYFGEDYDFKENLLSSFAGIRPLVKHSDKDLVLEEDKSGKIKSALKDGIRFVANKLNTEKDGTKQISRSHVIEVSDSGLFSLMGGKWTSFRRMG